MRRPIIGILKTALGLVLLYFSVRGIHWDNLISGMRSADLIWLIVAILSVGVGLALKLLRWAVLLENYQIKVGFSKVFSAYFVGQAVNIILPFRGGELVRTGYFVADDKKVLPEIVSTILIEKYMDLIALTVCGMFVSIKFSLDSILNLRGLFIPLSLGVSIALFAAIIIGPTVWRKVREKQPGSNWLTRMLDQWLITSQWLLKPKNLAPTVLLTVLIWGVMWSTNLLLFRSLALSLGGTAAGLVLVSVYIGLLPALMPGNIGPFYLFARLALLPYGVADNQAVIFSIILHAIVTLPPLLIGGLGLLIAPKRRRPI